MISRRFGSRISPLTKSFFGPSESQIIIHTQDPLLANNPFGNHHGTATKAFPGVCRVLYSDVVDGGFVLNYVSAGNLIDTK